MRKEDIKRLQELAFELEGLIGLAVDRPDMEARLPELVRNKLRAMEVLLPSDTLPQFEDEIAVTDSEPELVAEPEFEVEPEVEAVPELEVEPELEAEPEFEAEVEAEEKVEPDVPRVGESRAPVFSVNDRFRFIRELFGGSRDAFDGALTQIAACDSYDEAEEYVLSDLELDPELPATQEFLTLIARYFF